MTTQRFMMDTEAGREAYELAMKNKGVHLARRSVRPAQAPAAKPRPLRLAFDLRVLQYRRAAGCSLAEATREIAVHEPELHEQYLAQCREKAAETRRQASVDGELRAGNRRRASQIWHLQRENRELKRGVRRGS